MSGSSNPRRLSQDAGDNPDRDVVEFAWAFTTGQSEAFIAFRGDVLVDDLFNAWIVDAASNSPAPVAVVASSEIDPGEAVHEVLRWDALNRLYFKSDHQVDDEFRLLRVDADGSNLERVPGTTFAGASRGFIGTFGISADGRRLAFAADARQDRFYDVFVVGIVGSTTNPPARVTTVSPPLSQPPNVSLGPNFFEPIVWSPDGSMLALNADYPLSALLADNEFAPWVLGTTANAGGVRVTTAPVSGGDSFQVDFSADSARLFFRGDLISNNQTQLYSTDDLVTQSQSPAGLLIQDAPADGDVYELVSDR